MGVQTLARSGCALIFALVTLAAPVVAMENLDRSRTAGPETLDAPADALLETCDATAEEQDCGLPIAYWWNITLCYYWGLYCNSFTFEHYGSGNPCYHYMGTLSYWLGESCEATYLAQCQCGHCN